jgi:hypothetical protein
VANCTEVGSVLREDQLLVVLIHETMFMRCLERYEQLL